MRCHRSDVYIAGFFPYGLGKENSDTGKSTNIDKIILLLLYDIAIDQMSIVSIQSHV